MVGIRMGRRLTAHKMLFERAFSVSVVAVGVYIATVAI